MKLCALVLTATVSATLSFAGPVERRQMGGILICNGANATGTCDYSVYELETCYDLKSPMYQNASTFAPDGEAFYCYPYAQECAGVCTSPSGCTLGGVSFFYQHKFDLSEIGWNKYISSFECHKNETNL